MKWLRHGWLLPAACLLLILGNLSMVKAQNCLVYEREMEHLFLTHEPQTPVPQQALEQIRARCTEPTRKMLLVYNFFRAVDAFQSTNMSDRQAYEMAVAYYNRAAQHFVVLTEMELEDPFFDTFYRRAEELEFALQDLAYDIGLDSRSRTALAQPNSLRDRYQPGNRMATRGDNRRQSNQLPDEWMREHVILPERAPAQNNRRLRGDAPQDWDLGRSNQRTRGESSPSRRMATTRSLASFPGTEYVGRLSDLGFVDYLRYRGEAQTNARMRGDSRVPDYSATQRRGTDNWQYQYTDPSSSAMNNARMPSAAAPAFDPNSLNLLVNVGAATPLTIRPGTGSPAITSLGFGEAVKRIPDASPVFQQGQQFYQVQTVNGQTGWLPSDLLVPNGRVGVIIEQVQAVDSRGVSFSFMPAEMVVLADFNQETQQAYVVGQDNQQAGWVGNLYALSVAPEDLEIADLIHEALSQTSMYARQAKLMDIERHPAFSDSPLADTVYRLLREAEGR